MSSSHHCPICDRHTTKTTTHHDDKDPNKNGNKVGEESECVLDVVHVPMVCPLDDLLGVKHHVSQENQEAKVELQQNTPIAFDE